MSDPVPVSVAGFTWTAAGAWGAFLTLLAVVVKQWVPIKRMTISADEKLRADLISRVEKLERTLDDERAQRKADEARERANHEAVIALMRHRLNNSDQCIDALLMLLKSSPEKVREAVLMIEEMRTRQRLEEAAEKASIHAAHIVAAKDGAA